ncbi:unnamed protein product [Plutella xylostella]|uniref:(diamondback moth) hypothetical protein n=1 Tax=Plutella xylostella TaxID=51655 RepID=A0A8S4EI90_PLUXY|nr:unnamed protein product [Plutella xylostella]
MVSSFPAAGETGARFGLAPSGDGEGGYSEWVHAMRLVARLPAGVPQHFRKKLWLTLAERHLTSRGVDWPTAERACFLGSARPDDSELGAQILKDLHRTGCSLFCGAEGRENQGMLRRVLLAYARWNKDVGYCQGFNMLAAIILEVMDKSEPDSLKVMIYLVEAVLPEGYFADDLRGLSADMAAFRDLLRLRLPRLASHMDHLQRISDGGGVEPPLPDVFTMQWFLTLYATWLPRESLLRIWDLVLLDGNEVLLLTALAIWDLLQDRILSARSADEYYSCMGGGAGAVWEAGDSLVARVVALGSAPELPRLRHLHRYRVTPPAPPAAPSQPPLSSAMQSMTKRGLRLFYSEDEGDSSDDGNRMALATVIPRREERLGAGDRLSLDIGALKRQYARLRERQRQAHVILAAACARHAAVGVPTSPTSLTVNNLLLGKSAIVSSRGRRLGPPPGAVPPSRLASTARDKPEHRPKTRGNETISWKEEKHRKSISRRNSVKWKDIKKDKMSDRARKASIDLDETGDGIIVSEREASEICASLRSRSSSDTSSYSTHSESSSDTSLCDDNAKDSDSEPDLPDDDKKGSIQTKEKRASPTNLIRQINELSPEKCSENISVESITKEISQYIKTDAGEPLRTYIAGFETKLKDTIVSDNNKNEKHKPLIKPLPIVKNEIPYTEALIAEPDNVLQRLNKPKYSDIFGNNEIVRPSSLPKNSKNFTELSPIDISPCNFDFSLTRPTYNYDFESNFTQPSTSKIDVTVRPPDIIDSLTMYPNFVPDIELSDKNISDLDSPSRSPGAESIVVSEDEPPIPLKIDKYFEHSPDFFGARITVTDNVNSDIHSRRPCKRHSRLPKKPDSLTLHSCNNDKLTGREETERASSLPQSHSFTKMSDEYIFTENKDYLRYKQGILEAKEEIFETATDNENTKSPKDFLLRSGRKNSERALQIIQENSKILSRILTKQSKSDANETKLNSDLPRSNYDKILEKTVDIPMKLSDSPVLKESTSDSLIGYRNPAKSNEAVTDEKNDFQRIRPISIDDPFSFETRNNDSELSYKSIKSPSSECLVNKTDIYGWENKGFLVKCDYKSMLSKPEAKEDFDFLKKTADVVTHSDVSDKIKTEWIQKSTSEDSRPSVTLPSSDPKDNLNFERKFSSDEYNFPLSSKYNDFVLSKASDICSKTVNQGPKVCENLSKTDNSQLSDFAHVVTSSISFTYEPSADDDSPIGAKSNSSDTLCQITSLDQVSTPISPKIFPRDTPSSLPKDFGERSDKVKVETDDTCSTITSLIETDTLSSMSYPRSPSTGSYHPFPTRPPLRMPKELGVRLGMYPKETISSPPK